MAMTLADEILAVDAMGQGTRLDLAGIRAQTLRATLGIDVRLIGHEVDDRVLELRVEFRRGCFGHACHVAGELAHSRLQAQADAEEGHVVRTGIARGGDLALEGTHTKSAWYEDAIHRAKHVFGNGIVQLLAIDEVHVHVAIKRNTRMVQRLDDGKVRVGQVGVFADDRDVTLPVRGILLSKVLVPAAHVGIALLEPEAVEHLDVKALVEERARNLVDTRGILAREDVIELDIAEHRDLLAQLGADLVIAPEHEEVRLDAERLELLDRMLRGLRLELVCGSDVRNKGHVDEADVLCALLTAPLAHGLDEGLGLDIAYRAANLGDDDIGLRAVRQAANAIFDGIGDVRNDLHGTTEKVALALLGDETLVYRALRDVGIVREVLVDEALIMTKVEIALEAIVSDEDLAVLEGTHRAGIDIEIGIHLLHGDLVATGFEQCAERGRRDALAQRRDDSTSYEDEPCHTANAPLANCALSKIHCTAAPQHRFP